MNEQVSLLFHEVADLPRAARENVFRARNVPPELRAEIESLLASDSDQDHSLTECIGHAAEAAVPANAGNVGGFCGPYRLIRVLGSGGMGVVYLAERIDGEIQQRVAIKMLHPGAELPSWQNRFLRERQLLANLNHPSIGRLFDAGRTDQGQPYIVMEYVEGMPIDVSAEGKSLREQLTLFLKVCEGVTHAHRHLIIHRDLKPSNILVDASGQPKLLDFGIAKSLAARSDQTQTVDRLLTPSYASPEQLQGAIQTTATDIYSLGAVLYKLLTGRSPHESDEGALHSIEILAGTHEVRAARRLAPDLPADIDFILQKALRKEPEERYPSVEAFAEDVRAFLEWRPVRARSGNVWYRTRKFVRRYRLLVAAATLTMFGLSIGLYVANRERVIAERRFSQVRQMGGKWIALDQDIRGLRNSTPARMRVIATALEYLTRIEAESGGYPELKLDIAADYLQVARLQGVPEQSNVGEFREAEASLRKADILADSVLSAKPGDSRALLVSARIAYNRMALASFQDRYRDEAAHAQKVIAQLERLKEARVSIAEYQGAEYQAMYDEAKRRLALASGLAVRGDSDNFRVTPSLERSPKTRGERLTAWGYNEYGQLGNGNFSDTLALSPLKALGSLVDISSGRYHSLALGSDGRVWAWGQNANGQLGLGSRTSSTTPQQVARVLQAVTIATGFQHSLAITADGALWSWGANFTGQLGNGSKIDSTLPVRVAGLKNVVAAAGGGQHSLAALADGTVWAWGYNSNGQLGKDGRDTTIPVQVSKISGVVAVAAGGAFSVALKSDGTVWEWGMNWCGQLGNGSNVDTSSPVRAVGLTRVVAIAAGDQHTLALKADGSVWAWGWGKEGELGNGANTQSRVPTRVTGLYGVVAISASPQVWRGHNLAAKSDGTVWSWGANGNGELGNGTKTNSNVPVLVPGVRGAVRVSAGEGQSLVLAVDSRTLTRDKRPSATRKPK